MFASCNAHNAHEEPNTESMQAIAEGDAFLATTQRGLLNGIQPRSQEEGTETTVGPSKLKEVIELVIENSPASIAVLKQRHNMHTLAGKWQGRNECHVANAGDGPVIWSCNGKVALFGT